MRYIRVTLLTYVLLLSAISLAAADNVSHQSEHIYADSFGNLVVISLSGYKRILIGQGWRAEQYQAHASTNSLPAAVTSLF